MLGGYAALISHSYPAPLRATAQNVLFNVGRGVGGLAPLWGGAISMGCGFQKAVAALSLLYGLDIVVLLFLLPREEEDAVLLPVET